MSSARSRRKGQFQKFTKIRAINSRNWHLKTTTYKSIKMKDDIITDKYDKKLCRSSNLTMTKHGCEFKDLNKWAITTMVSSQRLNIFKTSILPNWSTVQQNPNQNPSKLLLVKLSRYSKIHMKCKAPQIAKTSLKKEKLTLYGF